MTTTLLITCIGVFVLAAVNGANDVSKGIATLVGSSVTGYRRAIRWGTICTALGGCAAIVSTNAMVRNFSGGLLTSGHSPGFASALACTLGAALWVLGCTRTGLPVSTSHAIVGAIIGGSMVAFGTRSLQWGALGSRLLMPLLLSPLAALVITLLILRTARTAAAIAGRQTPLNRLHWFSSGITSFARGMNDSPKIAALLVGTNAATAAAVSWSAAFAVIIAGMVVGSIIGGRRVTEVLAERIVQPTPRQGFAASVVTATLVIGGAIGGLPMSTTHVSASAIAATGIEQGAGALNGKTLRQMAIAWVVTLPGSGILSAAVYASLHVCGL